MKKLRKTLLPGLLTVLIAAGLFGGTGLLSRLLPDYTGQVYRGYLRENVHKAFYIDENEELLVYPWDTYNESVPTLSYYLKNDASYPAELGIFLCDTLSGGKEEDWNRLSEEIRVDLSQHNMLFLPETEVGDSGVRFSIVLDDNFIYYLHVSGNGAGRAPVANPAQTLQSYVDDMRRRHGWSADTTPSPTEAAGPSSDPLPEASSFSSEIEGPSEEIAEPSEAGATDVNPIEEFLTMYMDCYNTFTEKLGLSLSAYEAAGVLEYLFSCGTSATFSREEETLLSLTTGGDNASALVLYYDEATDAITGLSLKPG